MSENLKILENWAIIYCLIFRITCNAPYFHYIIQTIGHVSIPKRHSFSPLCLLCACGSSVLQNFKIFTHLLTEVEFESCVKCNYFNDRARKVQKTFPEGCKIKSGIIFRYCKTNILQLLFDNFSDVIIIVHLRYYHPRLFLNVDFLSIKAVCKIK